MKLLANEFTKIKSSKAVKGVMIAFLFLVVLCSLVYSPESESSPAAIYGFGAPFLWLSANGASGFFLYAAIVAGMVAGEFESDVIHNALSSGVGRGRYFLAKVTAVFGVSVLLYVACVCTLCIFKSIKNGFDPDGYIFSDYGLKVLVFSAGALISILAYVALYLFIAYLFREAVLTFIAAVVISIVELFTRVNGPLTTAANTISYFVSDNVLSWDFVRLFIPCAWMLIICLAAAYILFAVMDVE